MNTMRPGSFGMFDGKVGVLSPEEKKALEAKNKKFVRLSLVYWLIALLVLILAFVVMVLLMGPDTEASQDSYLGMMLVPFVWIFGAGIPYAVIYWVMFWKKPKAEKKENRDPWE